MAEYEIRISGVHYGANGDSVAGWSEGHGGDACAYSLTAQLDRPRKTDCDAVA